MSSFRMAFPDMSVIVKNIIIINVILVLAQFALFGIHIDLQDYLALHYFSSPHFGWWQFITHIFMHGSPNDIGLTAAHIFFNMYGLFMFGSIIEDKLGPQRFLVFYLICGIGAALCQLGVYTFEYSHFHNQITQFRNTPDLQHFTWLVHNNSDLRNSGVFQQLLHFWTTHGDCNNCSAEAIAALQAADNEFMAGVNGSSLVGASGAVFGVLFAFGYYYPNTELYIMFIPVPIKAKWAVAGYAAIELWSGFGRRDGDNVAHFAHLGGMLFAFILLWLWRKKIRNSYY